MGLSSNSIIHFTNTKENLKGILTDNFKIKYCIEAVILDHKTTFKFAAPMVSFCDIPLSEIKKHLSNYGPYGIGLTKEWAEKNGLNPVLYLNPHSIISKSFIMTYNSFLQREHKDLHDVNKEEIGIINLFRYIKNYEGDLVRGGVVKNNYRYSDEREWRYVPEKSDNHFMIIPHNLYDTEDKKRVENEKCKELRLSFEPNDIKYIIIESDNEITEFLQVLRSSKGKTYKYEEVERLMTRIITTEQIHTDF